MNHDEIINQLKDIHWPSPPGIWPLAVGYYLVGIVIFLLVALLFYVLTGRKKRQLIKAIRQEFLHIASRFKADGDVALLQGSITALVRRVVFYRFPNEQKDHDLTKLMPLIIKVFPDTKETSQLIHMLEQDRYKRHSSIDAAALLILAEMQVKRCRI